MAGENSTTEVAAAAVVEEEVATAAIPTFCPICGKRMSQGYIGDVLCWICPDAECGYLEPV